MKTIVAMILLCLYLPVPFILIWFHSLHLLWKRFGRASYILHVPFFIGMILLVIRFRSIWPVGAWSWPPAVSATAAVPFLFALWLALQTHQILDIPTIILLRQFSPGDRRKLIIDGIYGRVRHPRYTMFVLIALANFLFTGFPLVLGSLVFTALVIALVIRLEERELLVYFGEAYKRYKREVPTVIPRIRARS